MKANCLREQQKTHSETVCSPDTLNTFSATRLGSAELKISERDRERERERVEEKKLILLQEKFSPFLKKAYYVGRDLTCVFRNTVLPNIAHYLF
jgi:hypothetical protein